MSLSSEPTSRRRRRRGGIAGAPAARERDRPWTSLAASASAALLGLAGCGVGDGPTTTGGMTTAVSAAGSEDEPVNDARSPREGVTGGDARAPSGTLLVTVHVENRHSAVDEPMDLRVETRNATTGEAALLLWNTPFEPTLSADAFRITRDGEPVPYGGRMIKRALPAPAEAIVRLAPDERLERTLDLARHYALDVPGTYAIELAPVRILVDAGPDGDGFATLAPADESPIVVERY